MRRSVEITDALRSRLASAAGSAGLDARALARKARLSHRVVRDLLSGARRRADVATIEALCRVLKIDPPAPTGRDTAAPARRAPWRRRIAIGAIGAVAVALAAMTFLRRDFTPAIGLASDGRWISVVDSASGAVAWQVEHNSLVKPVVIGRGRGPATVYYGLRSAEEFLVYARDARRGDLRWGYLPDRGMFTRVFGAGIIGDADFKTARIRLRDLDGDGRDDVTIVVHHQPWYPSSVVFLRDDGGVLSTYYTCGSTEDVTFFDLDGDGREECIAYGTSNARALPGGMISVLDWRSGDGASIDSLSAATHFAPDCPLRDTARARVAFPGFDPLFMERLGAVRLMVMGLRCERSGNVARIIAEVGTGTGGESVRVTMDDAFRVLAVEASAGLAKRAAEWPDRERFLGGYLRVWAEGRVVFAGARDAGSGS